jgi:hypothetical protein
MNQQSPDTSLARLVKLKSVATRFRLAIERCDRRQLPVCMQGFPAGACGDATLLLGTFLADQGLGTFMYVLGTRTDNEIDGRYTHAWLEGDGIIVDITADQFSEVDERVIVSKFSEWHSTFDRDEPNKADYRIYDRHTVASLGRAYATILTEMERA